MDFKLTNALGQDVILFEELAKGPVVLVFYRGGWCPFCNMQLKAYQQILPENQGMGAQLIAISQQKPDHSLSLQEKEGLEFQVLSRSERLGNGQVQSALRCSAGSKGSHVRYRT
ncbi:peroxiredoxin-like family protein [Paenibacillus sp. LjRoot56]